MRFKSNPGIETDKNTKDTRLVIVTVSKDDPKGLKNTLDSTRNQRSVDFWHFVIDSSTDKSAIETLICSGSEEYIWTKPNGIYDGMNVGLHMLKDSDYVWFLNSGDTLADNQAIERVLTTIHGQLPNLPDWIVGKVILDSGDREVLFSAPDDSACLKYLLRAGRTWFPHPSTIVAVSALKKIEPFTGRYSIAEDYFMSLKLLKMFGQPVAIQPPLVKHALNGVSNRKMLRSSVQAARARVRVFGPLQTLREPWNLARRVLVNLSKRAAAS